MAKKKPRKCPFCNRNLVTSGLAPDVDYNSLMSKWVLLHSCLHDENFKNGVSVWIVGETKEEVIDKWNGVQHEQEHLAD